jgi:hypothetical protein
MSPAPAVTQPHAKRLSVSQPVDMHAHAIIPAPMTNTKSEPIANLRIQGIVNSKLEIRLSRSCNSVRLVYICQSGDTFTFFSPRVRWARLLVLFNSK